MTLVSKMVNNDSIPNTPPPPQHGVLRPTKKKGVLRPKVGVLGTKKFTTFFLSALRPPSKSVGPK